MVATTDSAVLFNGNASNITPYPVAFPSLDPAHIIIQTIAPGTGTVAVAAGVATFSASQTLEIGGRVRIAAGVYYIATRVSATVYTFTTRPTITSTTFWLPDVYTELAPAEFTYTVDGSGVLNAIITDVAVPVTSLVLVFRRTPLLQETELPGAGSLPNATLERMADREIMIDQETRSLMSGIIPSTTVSPTGPTLTQNSFAARTASGSGAADTAITIGGEFSLSGNTLALANTYGDVFGPASVDKYSVVFFSDTTGKHLAGYLGTNPSATPFIETGEITNTTARPLYVEQSWDNAALVGRLFILNAEITAADALSTLQEWQVGGSNRGKLMNTGELRLLDGSAAYPIYSFGAAIQTGMYRDAGGQLRLSVAGADQLRVGGGEVRAMVGLACEIAGVTKLLVGATNSTFGSNLNPDADNTYNLGASAARWLLSFVVKRCWSTTVFDSFGAGTPEGAVAAGVGSTYRRTDGGANTTFYVKESGTGNTGWAAK